ncbi:MAG: hypothetical protein LUE24_13710 [Lachnospiraceae bacterium]|nr:hypothetical protein [Lachnospiraceae bacterium]
MKENSKKEVEILRPTDFSQNAYLERRKQYIKNLEEYLNEKGQEERDALRKEQNKALQ